MLTEQQRTQVWKGWLESEMRSLYFADLCGSYRNYQRALTWLSLTFSSGAFVAVMANSSVQIKAAVTLAAAGVSLLSLVAQNQKSSTDCADLHFRWNRLSADYERLWNDLGAADAAVRLGQLEEKAAEASKSGTAFPYRKSKMRKWQDHVEREHGVLAA